MSRLVNITAALGALAMIACTGTTDPVASQRLVLASAEAKWNAAGIHDYDFDMAVSYLNGHDSLAVQVRNDQIVSSTSYLSNPHPLTAQTVPQLFGIADQAIGNGTPLVFASDPQLGYPVSVDLNTTTPGGPSSWQIVNFTRVP